MKILHDNQHSHYFIKQISNAPVRYAFYIDQQFRLSIGVVTKKYFFNHLVVTMNEKVDITKYIKDQPNLLDEVVKIEDENLKQEMFTYLAGQETSPRKLDQWLTKRKILDHQKKEYLLIAHEMNFINIRRFIEFFVDKKFNRAQQPWWLVKKELGFEINSYHFLSGDFRIDDLIDSCQFDDLEMLKKNFPSWPTSKSIGELKKKLINKGFSYAVIVEYLNHLENQSRNA